jgi:hypothetical protein
LVFSAATGRIGNLEIHTMLADGTGSDNVTFTGADNLDPSWQPVVDVE